MKTIICKDCKTKFYLHNSKEFCERCIDCQKKYDESNFPRRTKFVTEVYLK